jgi:hypothetical protein
MRHPANWVVGLGGYYWTPHATTERVQEARAMDSRWWAVLWLELLSWVSPARLEVAGGDEGRSHRWAWRWTTRADVLLLSLVLMATGCASVSQAHGHGGSLSYAPRDASSPVRREASNAESPRAPAGPEQRLLRRQQPHDDVTAVGNGTVGGGARSAALTRQAVLDATNKVKGSLRGVETALTQLAARPPPLGGRGLTGVFTPFLAQGSKQVTWLRGALGSTTALTKVASEVGGSWACCA